MTSLHWSRISRLPATSLTSSTLTKLKINVISFTEYLFLLDAHLEYLLTLIIHVQMIYYPIQHIDNTVSIISYIKHILNVNILCRKNFPN
jgi:hypothetical protein